MFSKIVMKETELTGREDGKRGGKEKVFRNQNLKLYRIEKDICFKPGFGF